MTHAEQARQDHRLLVLPPVEWEGAETLGLVSAAGIPATVCPDLDALVRDFEAGAAAVLIPEEALATSRSLASAVAAQPPWSDLPILVLTRPGADSRHVSQALQGLGNVTLLERPLRTATLMSAIRTALRARDRQYQIREYVADRTRTEAALHEADRRKDEFLATLGHELRNPLSPLLTSLHLLKFAGPADPLVARTAAVMQRQLHYLVRLVDDLLEVSRITRGVIDVTMEPLELVTVLAVAIENGRHFIEAARLELIVELPDESLMIRGDSVRLTQTFSNLINNAAKYTEPGGHIWIHAHRDGDDAVVAIRDDGIGISAEHLSSIFDLFTQVDRSHRRTQGGLGIGLTLVRSLVGIHGGSVTGSSEGPGRGSTFEVRLPLIADRQVEHAGTPPQLGRFDGERVLIVDDNRDAGEMLGSLLTALGALVYIVESGGEALDVIQLFRPDAVLLDIGMPGLDGYDVARRIRRTPGTSGTLLIALTGWGQLDDRRRSEVAGFDHHLVKPPDVNTLSKLIGRATRRRRALEVRSAGDL